MKTNFNCIIIDDEPEAIVHLSHSLKSLFGDIKIVHTFSGWYDALNGLRALQCDIVFMDVSLSGNSSLSLLRMVPHLKSEIIFVTAYKEYAIEAFDFSTSGYLLKPYNEANLLKAVNKALMRLEGQKHDADGRLRKLGIPGSNGVDYIPVQDILYIETMNRCSKITTRNGELISSYNIGKFKELLDPGSFFQIHRSFVVNINHITRYLTAGSIVMANAKEIPISKAVKDDFLDLFDVVSKSHR